MSERAEALLDVLADETGMYRGGEFAEKFPGAYRVRSPEAVARAICEHLGLTWETHDRCGTNQTTRDIFATLLEAAGMER